MTRDRADESDRCLKAMTWAIGHRDTRKYLPASSDFLIDSSDCRYGIPFVAMMFGYQSANQFAFRCDLLVKSYSTKKNAD